MKLSRRPPPPDPEARRQALSRLQAASRRPAPQAGRSEDFDEFKAEDPEVIRGGWTPPIDLPDRLKGPLWTLSPRHVVVLAIILVVGLTWAAYSLLRTNPEPIPTTPGSLTTGSPVATPTQVPATPGAATPGAATPGTAISGTALPTQGSSSGAPGSPTTVVVHVAGKVRRPGLVRTPTGSRVADVLEAAGGALPGVDLTSVNLARQVTDGEQIVVGMPALAPVGTPTAGKSTGPVGTPGAPSATPVDLNTATLAQLDGLPGVGPVLAQRILDWRNEHGRFTSTDELQEVPGVGPKKFESLKPHVRV
ncbi:helix-hairpin-helix domain-containing protein [Kribbella sp. CA-293567]|uniref:helix-hairpin-helix domain-containing protein n=1 Tax=Kribbella sp. CA-293567 TaxID=3002436 RepID=UPI0022DE6467|nr:helix-hairpin-helix domain-containing protein [Kribbella sp. CA-293567]WBQ03187.1 helix-hairpin-helix domain-containing protein [Kribbella sp. CA-293567]